MQQMQKLSFSRLNFEIKFQIEILLSYSCSNKVKKILMCGLVYETHRLLKVKKLS